MIAKTLARNSKLNPLVGVVGGGQLAQMLVQAAKRRNIEVFVQTSSKDDPAANHASRLILSNSHDHNGTRELLRYCSSITFENEWVDVEALKEIVNSDVTFYPSLEALGPLVNKISQRNLLNKLDIPAPDWIPLSLLKLNSIKLPKGWQFPIMAKASSGGYDGKGTKILRSFQDLKYLLSTVDHKNWLLEKWVQYDQEFAVIASRDISGQVRTFPLVETHQLNQICDWVLAPADIKQSVSILAYNIVASLLVELNYVGVIAIEFFYGNEGLIVNEIAPRTHNSGHFSIEACTSSQFDQQICIASGLAVPTPQFNSAGAMMINLLGLSTQKNVLSLQDRLSKIKAIKGAHLHWYGKNQESPGRKLGHVTFLLDSSDAKDRKIEALSLLKQIRSIWPIYTQDLF